MAALAAGAFTTMAQSNVYSLNVVGYINLPLTEGFSMVANQLDLDGTGTNNTDAEVFGSQLPAGATVYTWSGSGYNINIYSKNKAGTATNWTDAAGYPLNPGQGAWVSIPAGAFGGTTQTVTTVGQVLQGTLTNPYLAAGGGFSIVSDQVPLAGALQTQLGLSPSAGDTVYGWDFTAKAYNIYIYSKNKAGTATNWNPSEPQISVGQGFWLDSASGTTWTQNFTVQ